MQFSCDRDRELDHGVLASALDRIGRAATRSGTPRELSLSAVAVLGQLQRGGARRITDLAVLEGLSQPAVTTLVNRLARDGLISRGRDPEDGRVVLVHLTDAGAAFVERRFAKREQLLADVVAGLPAADVESLRQSLPALVRLADRYEAAVGRRDPAAVATGTRTRSDDSQEMS